MSILPSVGHSLEDLSDLPKIPAQIISMDGQVIALTGDIWSGRVSPDGGKFKHFNWDLIDSSSNEAIFTNRAIHIIKLYVVDRISKRKIGTAKGDYSSFLTLNKWLKNYHLDVLDSQDCHSFNWKDLTEGVFQAFLYHGLNQEQEAIKAFYKLRSFYEWGVAHEYPDFCPYIFKSLQLMQARQLPNGHNVRFRHPTKGPFNTDEKFLITQAVASNLGAVQDRVVIMLHLELGCNPNAFVRLKNKDFHRYQMDSKIRYQLDIPRVKKGTINRETKRRPITDLLGQLIEKLMKGQSEDYLLHWLSKVNPERSIDKAMQRFSKEAGLISPRTGEQLDLHPRRFRCTLASHMAEEGASIFLIAEMLDHAQTRTTGIYIETASSIIDAVASATDSGLVPLVNRFLGKIIDSLETPVVEGRPNQIIPGLLNHLTGSPLNVGGIGACGHDIRKDGLCRLFPPLSCYACPDFHPLRGGNHEAILDYLSNFIKEQEGNLDNRILMQLNSVLVEIKQFIEQKENPGMPIEGRLSI